MEWLLALPLALVLVWSIGTGWLVRKVRSDSRAARADHELQLTRLESAFDIEMEMGVQIDKLHDRVGRAAASFREEAAITYDIHRNEIMVLEENYDRRLRYLEGQLSEARIRGARYDFLLAKHEWHVGGRIVAHGREPMIQYECRHCPARVLAPEGFFEEGL